MSQLASCFANIIAGITTSVYNAILSALDVMQERSFKDDIQRQIDALCAVEKGLLATEARIVDAINKLDAALSAIDGALANFFCPDMSDISNCMHNYRNHLQDMRNDLGIPGLQARIADLQARRDDMERCGFMASKVNEFTKNLPHLP